MIVSIRSAVACQQVITDKNGRTDYLGVLSEQLDATTRPGELRFLLTIRLELDGAQTRGLVRIHTERHQVSFPYDVPEGFLFVGVAVPLVVPVIAEGPLLVDIYDEAQQDAPFRIAWSCGFTEHAEVLDKAANKALLATGIQAGDSTGVAIDFRHDLKTRH